MESLADIRLFVEAANLGGLSAAGRKLGLSPAAASARLVKLESSLNIRLFERTTRQLRLTEEGRTYLEHCQIAIQALEDGRAALHAERRVVRGRVRISATCDFGRRVLQGWLDEFNDLYPEVVLTVILTDSVLHLLQDEIDLAIRFGAAQDSNFVARYLADNRRVLCASPEYVARHGLPEDPDDLHRFHFIVRGTGSTATEWRFTRGEDSKAFALPMGKVRQSNDGMLVREWALSGHGLAMKSVWDVSDDVKTGRLVIALPEWRTPDRPIHAFYQRSRHMAPRLRALTDFLAARFAQSAQEMGSLLMAR